jgi:hypothetical protein
MAGENVSEGSQAPCAAPEFRAVAAAAVIAVLALLLVPASSGATASHVPSTSHAKAHKPKTKTWYVSATARSSGSGSRRMPFRTLAAVQRASRSGDKIVVLTAPVAVALLDGGIQLKPRQRLVGAGPAVAGRTAQLKKLPAVENTNSTNLGGDAIRLSDMATVRNVVVKTARRGGIYGRDVKGVYVHGNDVTATNTSCTTGFVVQPFNLPTMAPGVGVPFSSGLTNGWAGIMIDQTRAKASVRIARNSVHDADCADGIDVRASGTANVKVRVDHNKLTRLKQDITKESILAIGMQTTGTARLTAEVNRNRETYIGTASEEDFGEADSEGLFANSAGRSKLVERVDRNTFAHGLGHISANCFETVASNGGPTLDATLTNSTCDYVVGDILEAANLSKDATLTFKIDHVRAAHSTFAGAQAFHQVEPGDDGDCLLEVASGAGSTTNVQITNSLFTDCVADGLGVVSNVVDGSGAAKHIGFSVRNSRISANKLANIRIANVTPVARLAARVEQTDLSRSAGTPIFVENADTSGATHAAIDLGGGALNSPGHNCIFGGNQGDVVATRYDLDARHDWWGAPGGPAPGSVTAVGSTVNSTPALGAADCGPVHGTVLGPLPPRR